MRRLEQIERELESLGEGSTLLPVPHQEATAPDVDDRGPDYEPWSTAIVAAVVKAVWANPIEPDAEEQLRRSSRARELRELRALATPIEFEPPAAKRPEPETAKPPSWAWAAARRITRR